MLLCLSSHLISTAILGHQHYSLFTGEATETQRDGAICLRSGSRQVASPCRVVQCLCAYHTPGPQEGRAPWPHWLEGHACPGTQSAEGLLPLSLDKVRQFVRAFDYSEAKGLRRRQLLAFTENGLRVLFRVGLGPECRESSCRDWGKCLPCQKDNPPTPVPWKHNPGL